MVALWARYQVRAHDARVVGAVPVPPRRVCDELQPELYRPRRRLSGQAADEFDGFASVSQQSLVDRPPPHAAGRRGVERIEHTATRLPVHERERRPPERQVLRGAAGRPVVCPHDQGNARRRIVARRRDLRLGRGEGSARVPAHRRVVIAEGSPYRWIPTRPVAPRFWVFRVRLPGKKGASAVLRGTAVPLATREERHGLHGPDREPPSSPSCGRAAEGRGRMGRSRGVSSKEE